MTRPAMQRLVDDLNRLIAADPAEHIDTHLGLLFSTFADDGTYRQPTVTFDNELGEFIHDRREGERRLEIIAGAIEADAQLSPFEVTLRQMPPLADD